MVLGPRMARRTLLAAGLAVTAVGAAAAPAAASVPRRLAAPDIAGTGDWEARDPRGSIDVRGTAPDKIIVHHTATENARDTSRAHAFALSRSIQDYHMDGNGWIDTGQNFTNSRGGHLTEGRHQSLAALRSGSEHVVGAHAGAQNAVSMGIENEGTYTGAEVPAALWESLVALCAYAVAQYGIAAGAIYGHRDYMATECPGEVLYGRLGELREAVGAATGAAVVHPVTWPLLRPGASGPVVVALQRLLRARGHEVAVDGVFGGATRRTAAGLAVPAEACYAAPVAEAGLFGGTAWARLVPELAAGDGGEAVRAAQVLLTARGAAVAADGRFGSRTVAAVRDFRAARGLAVRGAVDGVTWRHLLGVSGAPAR
ncbi:N-acetylmuramoyl-L-alanine amidase [Saccharopolyspora cebuensis]|uniref:N-acetylmuramoyl-L-alanine amidase n=1 Tax=Saccharopolyspora cebuensis TaxID=418759 RepID=A0ABV4CAB0_9PSEU